MIPNTHRCSVDLALGFYIAEKKGCLLILSFDSAFGSFSHTIMALLKCLEDLLYWEHLNTIGNPRNNFRSFQDPVKPMEHLQIWQLKFTKGCWHLFKVPWQLYCAYIFNTYLSQLNALKKKSSRTIPWTTSHPMKPLEHDNSLSSCKDHWNLFLRP